MSVEGTGVSPGHPVAHILIVDTELKIVLSHIA